MITVRPSSRVATRLYKRLWPATVTALAVGLGGTLVADVPDSAAAVSHSPSEVYTCGTTSNYFDGKAQPLGAGNSEGAYGYISTRYGAVCDTDTSPNNFQNPWVMITGGNSNDGWAQSGYTRWYNHCTVFFAEQTRTAGGAGQQDKFGTTCLSTGGATYKYTEEWNASCGCLKSIADGTTYLSSSWNPFSYWTTPFQAEFFGETTYLASDISGNSASSTAFTSLHYQNISDDSWHSLDCGTLGSPLNDGKNDRSDGEEWFRVDTGTCPEFAIYTDTSVTEGSSSDPF